MQISGLQTHSLVTAWTLNLGHKVVAEHQTTVWVAWCKHSSQIACKQRQPCFFCNKNIPKLGQAITSHHVLGKRNVKPFQLNSIFPPSTTIVRNQNFSTVTLQLPMVESKSNSAQVPSMTLKAGLSPRVVTAAHTWPPSECVLSKSNGPCIALS